jgi:hypothetical protein
MIDEEVCPRFASSTLAPLHNAAALRAIGDTRRAPRTSARPSLRHRLPRCPNRRRHTRSRCVGARSGASAATDSGLAVASVSSGFRPAASSSVISAVAARSQPCARPLPHNNGFQPSRRSHGSAPARSTRALFYLLREIGLSIEGSTQPSARLGPAALGGLDGPLAFHVYTYRISRLSLRWRSPSRHRRTRLLRRSREHREDVHRTIADRSVFSARSRWRYSAQGPRVAARSRRSSWHRA